MVQLFTFPIRLKMKPFSFLSCLLTVLVTACAPAVVQVPTSPMRLQEGKRMQLSETVRVGLSTGYSSVLKAHTEWHLVGKIDQGEIYKTRDQVLTVEGSHIHEAYIVVEDGCLVGFYLPVEQTFSPVDEKVSLPVKE